MWCYVFAIKIKYNGRKKVRHYARYLHCYYDYSVFPSIHITFSKKSHFTINYTDLKKEILTNFLRRAYYICIYYSTLT